MELSDHIYMHISVFLHLQKLQNQNNTNLDLKEVENSLLSIVYTMRPTLFKSLAKAFDMVVYNGSIVNAGSKIRPPAYIGIKNEKIQCISSQPLEGEKMIDAKGGIITPGGIDPHVHVCQPCSTDTFESASRSSLCGGTTSMLVFATQDKGVKSVFPDLDHYMSLAKNKTYCDYGMHMIVTDPTPKFVESELPVLVKKYGITSVKVYMTYKIWSVSDKQILRVLIASRKLGITTMIHAENDDVIDFLIEKFEKIGLTEPFYHSASRPSLCEDEASYRAISLAKLADQGLLIVHMSTKESMEHVRVAQTKNYPIYSETCPQYMFLTSDYLKPYEGKGGRVLDETGIRVDTNDSFQGAKYICSPPVRDSADQLEGVWNAVENGTVTIYSSDHSPCQYNDSERGKKKGLSKDGHMDFAIVPNGLPGVETRMPLLYCYGVETGRISAQRFVEIACSNPAKLYGMKDKGSINVGKDADLVVWYPKDEMKPFNLTNEDLHHDIDYTPFEGMKFTNWPRYTILRGNLLWNRDHGGFMHPETPIGHYIKRGESMMKSTMHVEPPKYVN